MDLFSATLPGYAELQCYSNFTFLRGASHAEELIERAERLGYFAIAVTDECSLAGVVRAHVAAKKTGVHLLIGAHFQLTNADGTPALAFTALAQNRDGYGNLSELITLARTRTAKGTYHVFAEVEAKDAARQCGATKKGTTHQMWNQIWQSLADQ